METFEQSLVLFMGLLAFVVQYLSVVSFRYGTYPLVTMATKLNREFWKEFIEGYRGVRKIKCMEYTITQRCAV